VPKISRAAGASDFGPVRRKKQYGGTDLELTGPTSDLHVGGNVTAEGAADVAGAVTVGSLAFTPSVATLAAVGDQITPTSSFIRLDNTSGGSLTLTSNPIILDPDETQPQLVILYNAGNPVVFTDGQGIQLNAATRTVGNNDTLTLAYSRFNGDWLELSFASN
jgi:hypothetical protein